MIAIQQVYIHIASKLLKYFCGYWETTKIFISNIYSNEIIPDENFQTIRYGISAFSFTDNTACTEFSI